MADKHFSCFLEHTNKQQRMNIHPSLLKASDFHG